MFALILNDVINRVSPSADLVEGDDARPSLLPYSTEAMVKLFAVNIPTAVAIDRRYCAMSEFVCEDFPNTDAPID